MNAVVKKLYLKGSTIPDLHLLESETTCKFLVIQQRKHCITSTPRATV